MTRDQRRRVVLAPLGIWAGLMLLLLATAGYAVVPHAPLKTTAALSFGVVKALLIALLFMQLRKAAGLVRVAALTGVVWLSFLYLFAWADYFTR